MTGATSSPAAPAPPRRPAALLMFVAVALVAVLRIWHLDADPPASMPDPTIMDEGLWADSARGHVLFPDGADWFSDDLGNAYLIAPLYTFLLTGVYEVFGVGLWQTRLLAALASIATAALAGWFVTRRRGQSAGMLAVLLVGICPLLDQHGRFAMIESTQGLFLLLSFVLLFPPRRSLWAPLAAGAAMGCAVLVKPNSVQFGVLPFAAAFLLEWYREARAEHAATQPPATPDPVGAVHRRRLREGALCCLGGAMALAAIGLPVWLPNWDAFVATVEHESGGAQWTLGDHLLRLGLIGSREPVPGEHRLWALLRHAPLCTLGIWVLLLGRARGHRLVSGPHGESALWVWLALSVASIELSYDHVARRQVLVVPAMAILCALSWSRRAEVRAPARPWPAWPSWFLMLLPAWILAKPTVANALAPLLRDATPDAATAGLLAGWLLLALLLAAPAVPMLLRLGAERAIVPLRAAAPPLLLLLAVHEASRLGAWPPHRFSIRDAQRQLAPLVAPGDIVLGQHAATLFQDEPVRTVRRVIAGRQYSSPRPNPDVAERLRPRFVLDYREPALQEFADVTATAFEPIAEVGLLSEPSGEFRFVLVLWRRL
ncbi:MAG: glycosyltransferase family 39 protein [Planctomycetota bacterium]